MCNIYYSKPSFVQQSAAVNTPILNAGIDDVSELAALAGYTFSMPDGAVLVPSDSLTDNQTLQGISTVSFRLSRA